MHYMHTYKYTEHILIKYLFARNNKKVNNCTLSPWLILNKQQYCNFSSDKFTRFLNTYIYEVLKFILEGLSNFTLNKIESNFKLCPKIPKYKDSFY